MFLNLITLMMENSRTQSNKFLIKTELDFSISFGPRFAFYRIELVKIDFKLNLHSFFLESWQEMNVLQLIDRKKLCWRKFRNARLHYKNL